MQLLEEDEEYLNQKGLDWDLVADSAGGCLILKNHPVSEESFDRSVTDLMVRIPAQYPMAALDMFYADPPLLLRAGGYPVAAEYFEQHAGRNWQRFSRHLSTPWRAGVDRLPMFLALMRKELHLRK